MGKPIIAYSIEAALKSRLFDEVMVSTDDKEIAEIARRYGANIPFMRSEKNSDDHATTFEVIKEVVANYSEMEVDFECACCVYATVPFVNELLLEKAFLKLKEFNLDSVFPVMAFSFPIQRALKADANDRVSMYHHEYMLTRSQDLEPAYHDAGQFYWMNIKACLQKNKILTDNSGSLILSELEGQDIDNETDWKLAELKYELLQSFK